MQNSQDYNQQINIINVSSPINWDQYFMLQAIMASFRSKDPSTKVGCVFVDQHHHQISMGYNGFVAGIDESQLPWGKDKSVSIENQKYGYVVHAEANAIVHSKSDLSNSSCYVSLFPCHECAKLLASKRIKEIIYLSNKHKGDQSYRISKKIFDLSNIKVRKIKIEASIVDLISNHIKSTIQRANNENE